MCLWLYLHPSCSLVAPHFLQRFKGEQSPAMARGHGPPVRISFVRQNLIFGGHDPGFWTVTRYGFWRLTHDVAAHANGGPSHT